MLYSGSSLNAANQDSSAALGFQLQVHQFAEPFAYLQQSSNNLPVSTQPVPATPPIYGFYCNQEDCFLYCDTYEEYLYAMSIAQAEPNIEMEEQPSDTLWEPFLEIFRDDKLTGPMPDPILMMIQD